MSIPHDASQRGEVCLLTSVSQQKVRPALVLSVPPGDADRALVTLVPHTTALRGSRFEVPVPARFLKAGGFDVQSLVTVPTAKLIRTLDRLNATQIALVDARVCAWLGLSHVEGPGGSSP